MGCALPATHLFFRTRRKDPAAAQMMGITITSTAVMDVPPRTEPGQLSQARGHPWDDEGARFERRRARVWSVGPRARGRGRG